jgi:hypothetical protein
MNPNSLLLLATLLAAAPAFAAGTLPEKANAKAAAHAALGDGVDGPEVKATPPTLPSQASPRAQYVQSNIAFGKMGADMRKAHSQAGQHAADQAGDESANRSAQGAAASAAKSANADSHAAAGLARAAAARGGSAPGTSPGRGR